MRFYRTIVRPKGGFFVSIWQTLKVLKTFKVCQNVKKVPIVGEHQANRAFLYHKTAQFAQIAYR